MLFSGALTLFWIITETVAVWPTVRIVGRLLPGFPSKKSRVCVYFAPWQALQGTEDAEFAGDSKSRTTTPAVAISIIDETLLAFGNFISVSTLLLLVDSTLIIRFCEGLFALLRRELGNSVA